jgi:hypothetical protein
MAERKIIHVSTYGDDRWTGRFESPNVSRTDGPLATLQAARDVIRKLRSANELPAGGAVVRVQAGTYELRESLRFEAQDSGKPDAPIVYEEAEGQRVRVIGGRRVTKWTAVTDDGAKARFSAKALPHIMQADLKAMGLTAADFGGFACRGHGGTKTPSHLELFFDGTPMQIARWPKKSDLPNEGFAYIAEPVSREAFVSATPLPKHWSDDNDIWGVGYWYHDWGCNTPPVVRVDGATNTVYTGEPHGVYGYRKNARYFLVNIMEELTLPGEWYLDRATGKLYFWPPSPVGQGEVVVSTLGTPLLDFQNASEITIKGIELACTRGDAVQLVDGRDVHIRQCEIHNVGNDGVNFVRGHDHRVVGCEIHHVGDCATRVFSGDLKTLEPANHVIHSNHMHHAALWSRTYNSFVNLHGVGVTVSHNLMHDHVHAAIFFNGNDHVIEFNEFYNVCLEGDDCGTMYAGRHFEWQGNTIRFNFIHRVGHAGRNTWGGFGTYLDDGNGGADIYGNVFQYMYKASLCGGGVNTTVHDNIYIDCDTAIWFDQRSAAAAGGNDGLVYGVMKAWYYECDANRPPFTTKYPNMDRVHAAFESLQGIEPWGSSIANNLIVRGSRPWVETHWQEFPDWFKFEGNVDTFDSVFVDEAAGDFRLDHSAAALKDFKQIDIPVGRIGLTDEYRLAKRADVWTHIEEMTPIRLLDETHVAPGRVRITLTNRGNTHAKGTDVFHVVEKTMQATLAPKLLHRQPFNFSVQAGKQKVIELEVDVPADVALGLRDIKLLTRGEVIRPGRLDTQLAYRMDATVAVEEPLLAQAGAAPGRVKLSLTNHTDAAVTTSVALRVEPADALVSALPTLADVKIPARGTWSTMLTVRVKPTAGTSLLRLSATAQGLKPNAAELPIVRTVPRFDESPSVDHLAELLADAAAYEVRKAGLDHVGATLRFAVAGEYLAIHGQVNDKRQTRGPQVWQGSCIEVFATSPDRNRIGHVFGAIPIGQVFLAPHGGGQPDEGYRQDIASNAQVLDKSILMRTRDNDAGYEISALIPLRLVALPPKADSFLLEVEVTYATAPDAAFIRAAMFGSKAAYRDSSMYGLMHATPTAASVAN